MGICYLAGGAGAESIRKQDQVSFRKIGAAWDKQGFDVDSRHLSNLLTFRVVNGVTEGDEVEVRNRDIGTAVASAEVENRLQADLKPA